MKLLTCSIMLTCAAFAQQQTTTHTQTLERHVMIAGSGGAENMQHFGAGPATAEFISAEMGMPGKLVTKAPYSADALTETTQTLGDGNKIARKSTAQLARDSEGRTRRVDKMDGFGGPGSGAAHEFIIIDDPVGKLHWMLDPATKTANRIVVSVSESGTAPAGHIGEMQQFVRIQKAPAAGTIAAPATFTSANTMNGKAESLGKRVMEGVEVEGTKSIGTIAAGSIGNERPIEIVTERWYSPELQVLVYSKRSDPRMGDTVYKLTNIQRAEPSRTLFEVPADYTVKEGKGSINIIRRIETSDTKK